jgi:hypothetical protein
MLLLSQGCCFIQSLLFSYVLREDSVKFSRIYFGSLSAVWTTWLGSVRVGLHIRDQGTTTASVHVSVTVLYLAMSSE